MEENEYIPSKLNKIEYWNEFYEKEIQNFEDNEDDIGEIWFGENAERKMIQYILDHVDSSSNILEVGMGNGHLLFELGEESYTSLYGADYSAVSVQFCVKQMASKSCAPPVHFQQVNILDGCPAEWHSFFHLVLDKGTFDAISLSAHSSADQQLYVSFVKSALVNNGSFLIVSCNYTVEELLTIFGSSFRKLATIPFPTYKYQNQTGQTVSGLCLQKIE